jgi:putative effector of murein hydrolase LrgA (UPF0299 family)
VGLDCLVDPAMELVARLRGPLHCVVNVLGMVVPEGVIFYLFFFLFFWAVGAQVSKMEAVDHHAYSCITNLAFFWPPLSG